MFLLDANVFITAARQHFSFEVVPGYWDWLLRMHAEGVLASVPAVRDELRAGKDLLSEWAATLPDTFWVSETTATVETMRRLATWAAGPTNNYTEAAVAEFLNSADFRLIAESSAGGHTLVTHEVSNPASRRRILIPDACRPLRVRSITPWELHREAGLRLTSG